MLLSEAKEFLTRNGYKLVEDTDDWDEDVAVKNNFIKHEEKMMLSNLEKIGFKLVNKWSYANNEIVYKIHKKGITIYLSILFGLNGEPKYEIRYEFDDVDYDPHEYTPRYQKYTKFTISDMIKTVNKLYDWMLTLED